VKTRDDDEEIPCHRLVTAEALWTFCRLMTPACAGVIEIIY
jgi:hypothetical protein